MQWTILSADLILIFGAVGLLLAEATRTEYKGRLYAGIAFLSLAAAAAQSVVSFRVGHSQPILGSFVLDQVSLLSRLTAYACAAIGVFSLSKNEDVLDSVKPEVSFLILMQALGVCVMVSSSHLWLAFAGFSLLIVCSVLMVGAGPGRMSSASAQKFLYVSTFALILFMLGMAILSSQVENLGLGDLGAAAALAQEGGSTWTIALGFVTIGILSPLFFAPMAFGFSDVGQGAPMSVFGTWSSLLRLGVLVFLGRIVCNVLATATQVPWYEFLGAMVAATALFGGIQSGSVLGIRSRVLGFSIADLASLTSAVLVLRESAWRAFGHGLLVHAIAMTGLCALLAVLEKRAGRELRGAVRVSPHLTAGVLVCLAVLAALPPLPSWVDRMRLVSHLAQTGSWWLAVLLVVVWVLTTMNYARIVSLLLSEPALQAESVPAVRPARWTAVLFLAVITPIVLLGFIGNH